MRYRNTIRGLWRYEPGGLTPEQKSPANRLPRWSFWGENNNTATATSNCHSNGGSDEQGAIQETRNGIAPQVFGGRGRGDRRRCDAGLPDDLQGPGPDLDALAEHLAVEGHLPRVRARLRQESERHDRRRSQDRSAACGLGGAGLRTAHAVSKGTLDGGHGVLV